MLPPFIYIDLQNLLVLNKVEVEVARPLGGDRSLTLVLMGWLCGFATSFTRDSIFLDLRMNWRNAFRFWLYMGSARLRASPSSSDSTMFTSFMF